MTRPHIAFAMCGRVFLFYMRREKRYEETMASQSLDDGKKEENEK